MSKSLSFFIAGIIQGSLPDGVHCQDYRREIAGLLRESFPGAEVFDPVVKYPDSLSYDDARGSSAFFDLMCRAGGADVMIAFVPEASMGTAIEIWNAFHADALVVAVSPLVQNWVIRYLADLIIPDLAGLRQFIRDGRLAKAAEEKAGKRRATSP